MAKLHSIAEIIQGDPQLSSLVHNSLPGAIDGPGPKLITIKIVGPNADLIAAEFWRSLTYAARQLNQRKAPNVVSLEVNG